MCHTLLEQLLVPVYCPVLTWGLQVHSWSPYIILFSPVGPMYTLGLHLSSSSHLLAPCTSLVPICHSVLTCCSHVHPWSLSFYSHLLFPCTALVPICHPVLTCCFPAHPWSPSAILFSPVPMYILGRYLSSCSHLALPCTSLVPSCSHLGLPCTSLVPSCSHLGLPCTEDIFENGVHHWPCRCPMTSTSGCSHWRSCQASGQTTRQHWHSSSPGSISRKTRSSATASSVMRLG